MHTPATACVRAHLACQFVMPCISQTRKSFRVARVPHGARGYAAVYVNICSFFRGRARPFALRLPRWDTERLYDMVSSLRHSTTVCPHEDVAPGAPTHTRSDLVKNARAKPLRAAVGKHTRSGPGGTVGHSRVKRDVLSQPKGSLRRLGGSARTCERPQVFASARGSSAREQGV